MLVSGPMEQCTRFSNLEFTTAMQNYLGLRCSLATDIVGEPIPMNDSRRDYRVDPWGRSLQTAHGWSGDTRHFIAHMELENAIANDIRSVVNGSMTCSQEVVNLFLPQIPECAGRSMLAGLSEKDIKDINTGISRTSLSAQTLISWGARREGTVARTPCSTSSSLARVVATRSRLLPSMGQ